MLHKIRKIYYLAIYEFNSQAIHRYNLRKVAISEEIFPIERVQLENAIKFKDPIHHIYAYLFYYGSKSYQF